MSNTNVLCQCGVRTAGGCPGAWEKGCDLGCNPEHVKAVEPSAQVEALRREAPRGADAYMVTNMPSGEPGLIFPDELELVMQDFPKATIAPMFLNPQEATAEPAEPEEPGFVRMPRTAAEAECMAKLGAMWLEANAPVKLAAKEPLTRFCPGCGSVGPVDAKYSDCCPDGGHARMIPESLAQRCHDLFESLLEHVRAWKDPATEAALQATEPVKVWCETCDGTGEVFQESQVGVTGSGGKHPCPDCNGNGFNLRMPAAPKATEPVVDATMEDTVMLPIIGAVPKSMVDDPGIKALLAMVQSIGITNRMACWDHSDMFDLRDILCQRAASPMATNPSAVIQWRKRGTSMWWDGIPDHTDGGGPYEIRTLYAGAAPVQAEPAYTDSTPQLNVGESSFEGWFATYRPAGKGDKQRARDAYAAGMGDPMVRAARTDTQIVQQTEKLAAALNDWRWGGLLTSGTYRASENTKAKWCWQMACKAQEILTATDPQNAVAELDGGAA